MSLMNETFLIWKYELHIKLKHNWLLCTYFEPQLASNNEMSIPYVKSSYADYEPKVTHNFKAISVLLITFYFFSVHPNVCIYWKTCMYLNVSPHVVRCLLIFHNIELEAIEVASSLTINMQHIPMAQRIFDLAVCVDLLLRLHENPFCWHRQTYSLPSCKEVKYN